MQKEFQISGFTITFRLKVISTYVILRIVLTVEEQENFSEEWTTRYVFSKCASLNHLRVHRRSSIFEKSARILERLFRFLTGAGDPDECYSISSFIWIVWGQTTNRTGHDQRLLDKSHQHRRADWVTFEEERKRSCWLKSQKKGSFT